MAGGAVSCSLKKNRTARQKQFLRHSKQANKRLQARLGGVCACHCRRPMGDCATQRFSMMGEERLPTSCQPGSAEVCVQSGPQDYGDAEALFVLVRQAI